MNNGLMNESFLVDKINYYIEHGFNNFVFKGNNGICKRFNNIILATKYKAKSSRKDDVFCKADVILLSDNGSSFPLSIKMHNVIITWESADGTFKDAIHDFSNCYGKPILPFGKRIIIPLDGDLYPFVFGDDIIEHNGMICIQKFEDNDFSVFSKDTIIINVEKSFLSPDDIEVDPHYKPCLSIRHDPKRNISDKNIQGYRAEISPIGDCYTLESLLNEIKFK